MKLTVHILIPPTMNIIARNKVRDITAFLKGHQERVDLFGTAVTNWYTFQDAEDPQSVVLLLDVPDLDKFGAVLHDPRNVALSTKHTVIQPVIVSRPVAAA